MAAPFLQQHHLYLTPLSPLHLGTGEDYQPTEYVISDGIMYVFDPAQATLNKAQYDELMSVAQRGNFIEIQKYFKKHAATFQDCAYKAIGVGRALEREYNDKLGKAVQQEGNGKKVHNQLSIECTAVNPLTHQPYIPGSAFKGSVRTALLDALTRQSPPAEAPNSRSAAKYENEKLGSFASDIMRLFKTADFMPFETVSTQIQYAVNHKKQAVIKDGKIQAAKGVTGRRETIQHAQYRRFQTACTIQHLLLAHQPYIKNPERKLPNAGLQPIDLKQLAIYVNTYHLPRWHKENQILEERNLVSPEWLKQTRQLIDDLKPQLEQGTIMLMRLGKNGGAESKTLDGHAKIAIKGKGGRYTLQSNTTTVWLAAQSDKETHGLLPFGWVLIEIDLKSDNAALKQWCERNGTHLTDTAAITAALAQQRQQAAERKQAQEREQQRIEQEKQAAEAEKQRQAAEQAAALAAMPPEERLIAQWQQKLAEFTFDSRNQQAHNELYQAFSQALQQAAQDFDAQTQKSIAEAFSWGKISKQQPGLFAGKREKEIKALLRQLRGE
ncbi:hypothetical protein [Neisseria dumasiana]|uniref:CRISPR type III A-associated protein Csm5 n=1 Tax=Neisseria dumasiana TaxID=1931275 RepID=A0ABX3WKY7_9NEIS|nr:hypothetical protein [Neisseria dumasiana]OSI34347.1 hypothetical protein BV913_07320 [Neisseria dumasiana]UOO84837.1 hypothetical protein LVJ88_02155 [Neisseria dumasiana]